MERPQYNLETPQKLRMLADKFSGTPVNWEHIAQLYSEYVLFGREGRAHQKGLIGTTGELHVRSFLEDEQANDPQIEITPIPFGTKRSMFTFKEGRLGSYTVLHIGTRNQFAEYDQLICIDGLPVVWEVKISPRREAREAYSTKKINKMLLPIHEYFRKEAYGYVVVTPKDQVSSDADSWEARLTSYGGLTIPMYADLLEFQQEVENNKTRFTVDWSHLNDTMDNDTA